MHARTTVQSALRHCLAIRTDLGKADSHRLQTEGERHFACAGATNPANSEPGTIRGDFCIEMGRNIIHGSDAVESAKKEIELWFPDGATILFSMRIACLRLRESWFCEQLRHVPNFTAQGPPGHDASRLCCASEDKQTVECVIAGVCDYSPHMAPWIYE